jgi:hypothetical protein
VHFIKIKIKKEDLVLEDKLKLVFLMKILIEIIQDLVNTIHFLNLLMDFLSEVNIRILCKKIKM